MSSKLIRTLAFTAAALAVVASLGAVALGRSRAQATLRVSAGSARVSSSTGRPVLSARFSVVNSGDLAVPRLTAWIEFVSGRRVVILHRDAAGPLRAGRRISLASRLDVPRGLAKLDWAIEACTVPGGRASTKPAADACRRLGSDNLTASATSPTVSPVTTTTTSPMTTSTPTPTTTTTATTTTATTPSTTVTAPTLTGPAGPPRNPPPVT